MIYWLQYLGRVVVASGMGETTPPRTPDRNFDGFFNGLSPWIIWLFLGLAVGMLPAAIYRLASSSENAGSLFMALGLVFVCLPYVLMALLMTFLHDDPFAAKPLRCRHRPHSARQLISCPIGVRRVRHRGGERALSCWRSCCVTVISSCTCWHVSGAGRSSSGSRSS